MRGEDCRTPGRIWGLTGSPPHARGRHSHRRGGDDPEFRLTPACAGKTSPSAAPEWSPPAHPRMRGEDFSRLRGRSGRRGSPPHARGRLRDHRQRDRTNRLTPACAGKTTTALNRQRARRAHPRMRGEDGMNNLAANMSLGSPPHARGRRLLASRETDTSRLTPACAGKTRLLRSTIA